MTWKKIEQMAQGYVCVIIKYVLSSLFFCKVVLPGRLCGRGPELSIWSWTTNPTQVGLFGVRPTLLITLGAHFCHSISSHHHIRPAITFHHILHIFQA